MRYKQLFLSLVYFTIICSMASGQTNFSNSENASQAGMTDDLPKHLLKSSLYLLGNIEFDEPVYDTHINYGCRLDYKSVVILEVMT